MDDKSIAAGRQTGRTSRQLSEAPPGAIFVWLSGNLAYPRALARFLGRTDIGFKPLEWLRWGSELGRGELKIVVDHAARSFCDPRQAELIEMLRERGLVSGEGA